MLTLTKVPKILNHQEVMAGFPQSEKSDARSEWAILFRIDGQKTLIQSRIPPVFPECEQRYLILPDLSVRSHCVFRVTINAIARQGREHRWKERNEDPVAWLAKRDVGAVFCPEQVIQVPGVGTTQKGRNTVPLNRWSVSGRLLVTDPDKLCQAIEAGLGRGKAWGCGLLSVVKIFEG